MNRVLAVVLILPLAWLACAAPAMAADAPSAHVARGFDVALGRDTLHVELLAPDTLHVRYRATGTPPSSSLVVDPALQPAPVPDARVHADADGMRLDAAQLHVAWNAHAQTLTVRDADGRLLLRQTDPAGLREGRLRLERAAGQPMYGIGGYSIGEDVSPGILRRGRQLATAGKQGHAGAPLVWSTAGYGVLLDTVGATFHLRDVRIEAQAKRQPLDYYVFVGTPARIFAALARVSGRAPLFPKWAMGFTNSQWGIDEQQLLHIVDVYRARHIPLDNFTLDFDWKDWGADHYGEFRWNPAKFPDGPDGKLKTLMDARGVHLTGIMKPRVHLDTEQGRYASAHHLWLPGEAVSDDYFSHKPVKDLDFDNPVARAWFFNDALKHSFATGIVGWWNDEADESGDDTQFLNMQRALYDGQRAFSDKRVWSINRNFYLGAQRYAYGLWSGDIDTGFASMAAQRTRMLSAATVGAFDWGMDGGGYRARPTPENYARWIEFGAFTPIFRVHGTFGEKRQPWLYGPVAEKAATAAIRLRYALIPYVYAYQYQLRAHGVGLVRPLAFAFPDDKALRNDVDAWMFGDWLLASPVVVQGQTHKRIRLPAGRWTDWFSGTVHAGGRDIDVPVDARTWSDIPLFVRQGAIVPTQAVLDHVHQRPIRVVDLDVFPDTARTHFDYYDDDGDSYAYEHGDYFLQRLSVQRGADDVRFATGAVEGGYRPALRYYLVKIHGSQAATATLDERALPRFADLDALRQADGEGWATGDDRFGPATYARIRADTASTLVLAPASTTAAVPGFMPGCLFHDQGPLFDDHVEPSARQAVTLTLRACKGSVAHAAIVYRVAGAGSDRRVPMRRVSQAGRFAYWRGTLPAGAAALRYRFAIDTGARTYWLDATGITPTEPAGGGFFVVPGFHTPDWMKNGVLYQVFPDRFRNGDPGNDVRDGQYRYAGCTTEHHAWGTSVYPRAGGCNSMVFFGGDLAGIDRKLDYIKHTLGADILYLNPVFASPTNHKYDTSDYRRVDPAFGDNATLRKLVADMHGAADGMRGYVILDGVFNHTGDTIRWFDKHRQWPGDGAWESKSSPWYGWYTFQHWPDRYSMFFDVASMPKLDYGTSGSAVRRRIYADPDSIMQHWLKPPYAIDGWRLDAPQYIDAGGGNGSDAVNHGIFAEMRTAVKSVNPDAEILGEFWGDAAPWTAGGDQWDGALNYDGFTRPASQWICGVDEAGRAAPLATTAFDRTLRRTRAHYPTNVQQAMANFLGSHDTPRFATRCGGDIGKTRLALILQMTYVGTPATYYGDEYGMAGGKDPDDRRSFDWNRVPGDRTVALTRQLIAIRHRYAALRTGSFMTLLADDAARVYAFGRLDAQHRIAVVLNNDAVAHTVTVPVWKLGMIDGSVVVDRLGGHAYTVAGGTVAVRVGGRTGAILVQ